MRTAQVMVAALLVWALVGCTALASAQGVPTTAAAGSVAAPPPTQPTAAGWQDGFVLQTVNGDYQLAVGLTAQTDGRFSLDDPAPITNTFTIRKARPTLAGRVARYFDFKVMPDFGSGTATLLDAYFDIRFSTKLRVRAGRDKTPVGYEQLIGDAYLLFPERALPSSLVPSRDVGIQAQGDLAGGMVCYAGGVFNGIPDGATSTADVDVNAAKDFAGRVVVSPFKSSSMPARILGGLGFQVGASTGRETGTLPVFKTSIGQTYFSYESAAVANGRRDRITPAVFYSYKSFGSFGEYVRSSQAIARSGAASDVVNQGWEVTAAFVLTGEPASDRSIRPKRPFDPAAGRWGAFQLVARYARLSIDPAAFAGGLAASGASAGARSFTVGANWYPANEIKYYLTYERTTFGASASGVTRPDEHVILFRAQIAF